MHAVRCSNRVRTKPIEYWNNERIHRNVFTNEVSYIEAKEMSKTLEIYRNQPFLSPIKPLNRIKEPKAKSVNKVILINSKSDISKRNVTLPSAGAKNKIKRNGSVSISSKASNAFSKQKNTDNTLSTKVPSSLSPNHKLESASIAPRELLTENLDDSRKDLNFTASDSFSKQKSTKNLKSNPIQRQKLRKVRQVKKKCLQQSNSVTGSSNLSDQSSLKQSNTKNLKQSNTKKLRQSNTKNLKQSNAKKLKLNKIENLKHSDKENVSSNNEDNVSQADQNDLKKTKEVKMNEINQISNLAKESNQISNLAKESNQISNLAKESNQISNLAKESNQNLELAKQEFLFARIPVFSVDNMNEYTNEFNEKFYVAKGVHSNYLNISMCFFYMKSDDLHVGKIQQDTEFYVLEGNGIIYVYGEDQDTKKFEIVSKERFCVRKGFSLMVTKEAEVPLIKFIVCTEIEVDDSSNETHQRSNEISKS